MFKDPGARFPYNPTTTSIWGAEEMRPPSGEQRQRDPVLRWRPPPHTWRGKLWRTIGLKDRQEEGILVLAILVVLVSVIALVATQRFLDEHLENMSDAEKKELRNSLYSSGIMHLGHL
ncbi:unnamed protein product [Amoebophrya sp. A25]|nr:unnamed protein product [Amoebophrya sp. A25]|eukprot:GSA25T00019672001.1